MGKYVFQDPNNMSAFLIGILKTKLEHLEMNMKSLKEAQVSDLAKKHFLIGAFKDISDSAHHASENIKELRCKMHNGEKKENE